MIEKHCLSSNPRAISNGSYVSNYIDLYKLTCEPKWLNYMVTEIRSRLFVNGWNCDLIAGKELHGALLASHVVANSFKSGVLIIRKNEYTLLSPSNLIAGSSVVLIDDITSAGINLADSLAMLESSNFNVVGALSVVYRGGGALEVAKECNIPFDYLLYMPEDIV